MTDPKYWKLCPEDQRHGNLLDDIEPAPEVSDLLERANHIIGSIVVGNDAVLQIWRSLADEWQENYERTHHD